MVETAPARDMALKGTAVRRSLLEISLSGREVPGYTRAIMWASGRIIPFSQRLTFLKPGRSGTVSFERFGKKRKRVSVYAA